MLKFKTVRFTQKYSAEKSEFMIKLWFLSTFCTILAFKDLTAVHYSIVSPGIDQNVTAGTLKSIKKFTLYHKNQMNHIIIEIISPILSLLRLGLRSMYCH